MKKWPNRSVSASVRLGLPSIDSASSMPHFLRQEISRTVSDPAEIDEEIHALCDALVVTGGRL